jgi:hypothetical protein
MSTNDVYMFNIGPTREYQPFIPSPNEQRSGLFYGIGLKTTAPIALSINPCMTVMEDYPNVFKSGMPSVFSENVIGIVLEN